MALSAFPANPACWSVVTVVQDDDKQQMQLRRGLLSVLPRLVPVGSCPASIAGTAGWAVPEARIVWQWEESIPLSRLRGLREQNCAVDAWLRFARTPSLADDRATDVRFGPPGAPNFSTLQLSAINGCAFPVPPWGYPRADLLGVSPH